MDILVTLSGLAESMLEKLGDDPDLWRREFGSSISVDIQKLQTTLLEVKNLANAVDRVLKLDFPNLRGLPDGHLLRHKLGARQLVQLTGLAYAAFDADDLINELHIKERRRRRGFEGQQKKTSSSALIILHKVLDLFPSLYSISFRIKMGRRRIRDNLTNLYASMEFARSTFNAFEQVTDNLPVQKTRPFEIDPKAVYGREKDKEEIIDFLINIDNDKSLSVLPIVGLPGVGKTTLAQLVYADERIKQHFDLQVWVSVGQNLNARYLALKVLEYATKQTYDYIDLSTETFLGLLRQLIDYKRFLLVLDDVRNAYKSQWEIIKYVVEGGMLGNKIMVITSSMTVASEMCTVATPYSLQTLSEDDCWILVKDRTSASAAWICENPHLEEIVKKSIKKCQGFPSAAKALGDVMASKVGKGEWLYIKEFQLGNISRADVWFFPTILSNHWPNSFKRCFSYLSLFPRGCIIDRLKLIQLWVEEEFIIRQSGEEMHAVDIGNQWFHEFLTSFFDYKEKDDLGNIASFRMNSGVHYLANSLAGADFFKVAGLEMSSGYYSEHCRYSSAVFNDEFCSLVDKAKKVKSLLVFSQSQYLSLHSMNSNLVAISNLINLRVLHLSNTGIRNLPSTIGKLKHLRFLDLSKNMIATPASVTCIGNLKQLRFLDLSENLITSLPKSITTLHNLETLILRGCTQLQELPEGVNNMSSLRYLDFSKCDGLTCVPRELGRLSSLQTLPLFIIGEEPGRTVVQLQHLNQLRGRLRLEGLCNVKDKDEVIKANLQAKEDLQCLELCWNRDVAGSPPPSEEVENDIVDNLQPHPNVSVLRIKNYNGYILPDWLTKMDPLSPFSNLKELSLHSLKKCENFSQLSQMPSLKRLDICCMDTIRIGREFYGSAGTFSSLEFLSLCDLPNLTEWFVPEADMFSSLQSFEISWCPKLNIQSPMPSSILKLIMISSKEDLLATEGALRGMSRLKKLIISGVETSKSRLDWLRFLTSLEELTISCCPQLTCLPVAILQQHFPSLHMLKLEFNSNLMSLLEEGDHPPLFFTALRHLIIVGCSSLTALPEWLGGLNFLQTLKLECCEKLSMLPDRIRCVKTLRQLTIDFCPILERRCKEGGNDWYKIAHIPNICINTLYVVPYLH